MSCESKINSIYADFGSVVESVNGLKTDISNLKKIVESIDTDVSNNGGLTLDDLHGSLGLNPPLSDYSSLYDLLKIMIGSDAEDVTLHSKIDNLDLSPNITTQSVDLSVISKDISDISKDISDVSKDISDVDIVVSSNKENIQKFKDLVGLS
jgi:archaellum component FlaC